MSDDIRFKCIIANMVRILREKNTPVPMITSFLLQSGFEPQDLELTKALDEDVVRDFNEKYQTED